MNFDNTLLLVRHALDASIMRHTAIAANIANANSINYHTLQVRFEEQLSDVDPHHIDNIAAVKPYYEAVNHPIALDEQMLLNVENITHYRALIKGLNQKLALMNSALEGNK